MSVTIKPGVINDWDLMERQVQYYRDHLDIFIEDQFAPIHLTRDQHVIARQFGNCSDCKVVCSRGFGKTWLTALCCAAICCLYPGTKVIVCSSTAMQATLVLGKLKLLAEQNSNIANEISASNSKTLVSVAKDTSKCRFKNGSEIESSALESVRGMRAKIIVADEVPCINSDDLESMLAPTKNYTRDICLTYGFRDFASKSIAITSACEKTNDFYQSFVDTAREMAKGSARHFACALNYEAAVANGITDIDFFMAEKERMPASIFDMEYDSIFVGSSSNSMFPYDLTQGVRTLETVELEQPKSAKSRYVISLDLATSESETADNTVISVIKYMEKVNGTYAKRLVYLRSFHGKGLDIIAQEIRKLYHNKFPNAEKIIYDARGLGDSFSKFLDTPWSDPLTGKEFPPLVDDDKQTFNPAAEAVLHPVRAVQALNQRMANVLRVFLEKRTIEFPKNSRIVQGEQAAIDRPENRMSPQEMAVYIETDALQYEMSNIIQKISGAGNFIYDTPRASMHKDRYSSVAMACEWIATKEEENVKRHQRGAPCIGIVSDYEDDDELDLD